ncbi:MAG: cysteine hydrolase family protein [Chloroflexota bacterium]
MGTIGPNTALIVVDVQQGFDEEYWGVRNNPQAEENIARLLSAWRRTCRPIFHIKHDSRNPKSPLHPRSLGNEIKSAVQPQGDEPLLSKSVNSAFIGTGLAERLHSAGVQSVVITGLTTNHCCETTARMAGNLGFETYFVWDATATFDRTGPDGRWYSADDLQSVTLANLNGEFATIITTDAVLEEVGARL